MTINGISVDVYSIAEGIYKIIQMDDNYHTALCLGMLPTPIFKSFRKKLEERFDSIYGEYANELYSEIDVDELKPVVDKLKLSYEAKKREFASNVEKEVINGIFRIAPVVT